MVSALFRAYWREGRDIGDKTTLADLAADVGLDRAPHEPAGRYLDRVGRGLDPDQYQHARLIVSLYNNLRYGQATHDPAGVQHFRTLVKSFKP